MKVVGVDGCRRGWVAVAWDIERHTLTPSIHWTFADLVFAHTDAAKIGIDIPIGLAEGVPRQCDIGARKVLEQRKSSVFPAPDPRLLDCATYGEARIRSVALCGKSVSAQAFGIYAKVKQVNGAMTPELQDRVIEVHPEVSFWAMAGERPMVHSKKRREGYDERRTLLANVLNMLIPSREDVREWARPAGADDILDAVVAAWTAHREVEGRAQRFPAEPDRDAMGLRMEIVF